MLIKIKNCKHCGKIKMHLNGRAGYRIDLNDGNYYKSSLEADYARYLNYFNIRFQYEPRTFELNINNKIVQYTPDFFLIDKNEYVELKGHEHLNTNYKSQEKLNEIQSCIILYQKDFVNKIKEKQLQNVIKNLELLNHRKTKHLVINHNKLYDITSINVINKETTTIDIEVQDEHTFYVSNNNKNFVLTHNSKQPDIDTDFESEGRERVKDYITLKYGHEKTASLGTFSILMAKNTFKDVSRVFEKNFDEVTELSKLMDSSEGMTVQKNLNENKKFKEAIDKKNHAYDKIIDICSILENQPRHMGIAAGGIVIADKDITEYMSLRRAKEVMVTEWDKYAIEYAKFLKIDILGIKTLSVMKTCLKKINKDFNWLYSLPLDDEKTYKIFEVADLAGVFQYESGGMRGVIKKLCPKNINDLVAINALYRPGALNMINSFIARKNGIEKVKYDLPNVEDILGDTYGIVVYQEQIILMLAKLCKLNLSEADLLRRGMEDNDDQTKLEYLDIIDSRNEHTADLEIVKDYIRNFNGYLFNKCLTGDTILYRKYNGGKQKITIKELINKTQKNNSVIKYKNSQYSNNGIPELLSYNENNKEFIFNNVKNIYNNGIKKVYQIKLKNGKTIKATENHRFLTNNGWKELKNIDYKKDKILNYTLTFWNDGLTKDTNDSLKRLSIKRQGNDHWVRKFGGIPHNKGKTKDFYAPSLSTSKKILGIKRSEQTKLKLKESHIGNKNALGCKHSKESINKQRISFLKAIQDGRIPQTNTTQHRKLREYMQKANIWNGFEDELPVGFHSIDIANANLKIAIFVDGDYYHASNFYMIKRNKAILNSTQKKNLAQDKSANTYLVNRGWIILRFWEHTINSNVESCIIKIKEIVSLCEELIEQQNKKLKV